MRRVSKKRAAQDRRAEESENDYRATYTVCQICRVRNAAELHHIPRGPGKVLSLGLWPCLLMLCKACHLECTESRILPPKQMAYKILACPEFFDLEAVNACLVGRIDAGDVLKELRELLAEG